MDVLLLSPACQFRRLLPKERLGPSGLGQRVALQEPAGHRLGEPDTCLLIGTGGGSSWWRAKSRGPFLPKDNALHLKDTVFSWDRRGAIDHGIHGNGNPEVPDTNSVVSVTHHSQRA